MVDSINRPYQVIKCSSILNSIHIYKMRENRTSSSKNGQWKFKWTWDIIWKRNAHSYSISIELTSRIQKQNRIDISLTWQPQHNEWAQNDNIPMIMRCVCLCVCRCGMSFGVCFYALKLCCHAKKSHQWTGQQHQQQRHRRKNKEKDER